MNVKAQSSDKMSYRDFKEGQRQKSSLKYFYVPPLLFVVLFKFFLKSGN